MLFEEGTLLKNVKSRLAGVAHLVECHPVHPEFTGLIPGCGLNPQ